MTFLQHIARRFPATDIEQAFDIQTPIFDAYSTGKIYALRFQLRPVDRQPRDYLGASALGGACLRKTWANWHNLSNFGGGTLRLFRTGDIYEVRMRDELRAIGLEVTGDQSGFEAFDGQVKGHTDGFVRVDGSPWALLECKTANHRRTTELRKFLRETPTEALHRWSSTYNTQAHLYMAAFGVTECLYMVTDKNTDTVVAFVLQLDSEVVAAAKTEARTLLEARTPPGRGYTRPQTPQCTRFCDHAGWCWFGEPMPRACGTCTQWRNGRCALSGNLADAVCSSYELVDYNPDAPASEWQL